MEKTHAPWKMRLASLTLIFSALYLLFFPRRASGAMTNALYSSVRTVVPAVFPYLVLSGIFVTSGLADRIGRRMEAPTRKLFSLPGCCGGVILLGVLCGFPVGGKMAGMLYERGSISKKEAERLLAFSDFCGPPYILTVLGMGVLQSLAMGFVILFVQTALALTAGAVLGRGQTARTESYVYKTSVCFTDAFTDAVKSACVGTLQICGYVTFFAAMMSAFARLFAHISPSFAALLYGFFEMSGGILRLPVGAASLIPATAIVLWSGLSVFMQVGNAAVAAGKPRLSLKLYLLLRAVIVPTGSVIVYFLCRMFGLIK